MHYIKLNILYLGFIFKLLMLIKLITVENEAF